MQERDQSLALVEIERNFFCALADEDLVVALPYQYGWKIVAHFNTLIDRDALIFRLNQRSARGVFATKIRNLLILFLLVSLRQKMGD